MSRLRIYGIARTRAFRALWIAMELGLDHEHIPIEIGSAAKRAVCVNCRTTPRRPTPSA